MVRKRKVTSREREVRGVRGRAPRWMPRPHCRRRRPGKPNNSKTDGFFLVDLGTSSCCGASHVVGGLVPKRYYDLIGGWLLVFARPTAGAGACMTLPGPLPSWAPPVGHASPTCCSRRGSVLRAGSLKGRRRRSPSQDRRLARSSGSACWT